MVPLAVSTATPELSLGEKRLLLALREGGGSAAAVAKRGGFASESELLVAAGGPQRAGLIEIHEATRTLHALTPEGARIHASGLPEARAMKALMTGPLSVPELAAKAGLSESEAKVIVGLLKKSGAADVEKGESGPRLRATGKPVPTDVAAQFRSLSAKPAEVGPSPAVSTLVERGLAQAVRVAERSLTLTPSGVKVASGLKSGEAEGSEVNQLTPEFVAAWATMAPAEKAKHHLRPFDFNVDVTVPAPGKPHPLDQMIEEIRTIFVGLGFREIAGDYVEPAFWNMDALFIPQDHPARDMQDTFYLKEPATATIPGPLFEAVKAVQTSGGNTGSTGWGGDFQRKESEKALLRTHTTVTTIRSLAADPKPPQRVFGIGRVFRNEAMDATHLPEFHQVEGIVLEEGADFSMLMGLLREFYTRLGFPDIRFRPSYYPYTEPSLDVAVKWQGRWLELGGAGVFRPEVTKPLGVPCNVLAWGLGLERLAMLRLGLKDIRDLYVSDIQWLRENPVR